MPHKATRLERAYRVAPVRVFLLNDQNVPEEVTLQVKYWPLTLQRLEEWEAIAERYKPQIVAPDDKQEGDGAKETPAEKAAREAAERERNQYLRETLPRQLADVVFDLDLTEDDGVTPKKVTVEYLMTLDLGLLKDIKDVIEERAFPEKKRLMEAILSKN